MARNRSQTRRELMPDTSYSHSSASNSPGLRSGPGQAGRSGAIVSHPVSRIPAQQGWQHSERGMASCAPQPATPAPAPA